MNKVVIIDFGSQVTQLIARRVRELGIYSEIYSYKHDINDYKSDDVKAIILSGGPSSVVEENSPQISEEIFKLDKPVLGICYGLQLMCHYLGGKVEPSDKREYGKAHIQLKSDHKLFNDVKNDSIVWMSHGDKVLEIPSDFRIIGSTEVTEVSAIANDEQNFYGVQFHPEVTHTEFGKEILKNFLVDICNVESDWQTEAFVERAIQNIKETVGDKRVLCGLSGGVDSSVTAAMIHKAIGDNLQCVFVDTGLLRKNERVDVENAFRENYPDIKLHVEDASEVFFKELEGVTDPEKKKKNYRSFVY